LSQGVFFYYDLDEAPCFGLGVPDWQGVFFYVDKLFVEREFG
jgi:hypothetical protein